MQHCIVQIPDKLWEAENQFGIEEPLSHDYEQAKRIDVRIFVNNKITPRKRILKER